MSCILCFISDDYQENLRKLSQSKSERFEKVLSDYQSNFLNDLHFLNDVSDCKHHKTLNKKTVEIATKLHKIINSPTSIRSFFEELNYIYKNWIQGDTNRAFKMLNTMLDDVNIFKAEEKVDNFIFFRGRKSPSILTTEELFHIPFNKRHLIQNQRFSITGQPLLYLGLSPVDVIYEIRQSLANIEDIYLCSLLHISNEQLWIYDITNPYAEWFSDFNISNDKENDNDFRIETILDISTFYKFILGQYCSFKRSRWSESGVFSEEYVIPQLLSSVIRDRDLAGILFSSTRVDTKEIYSTNKNYTNRHRENLALFTNHNDIHNIDKDLFDQFIISKPITYQELAEITIEDLITLRKQVGKLIQKNKKAPFKIDVRTVTGIDFETRFEKMIIDNPINQTTYFDHTIGKIHIQLIYQMLLELRNRMNDI